MNKIGITGGIGSGKTLVCKVFKSLGIPVYEADEKARSLVESDAELRKNIIIEFGPQAYLSSGYNRKYIGEVVFNQPERLKKLNQLIHPIVLKDYEKWLNQNSGSPYTIKEAAILFETGADKLLNFVIAVEAPMNIRIQRIQQRDKLLPGEIHRRMTNQWSTEKIRPLADWIIYNNNKTLILPQILKIHNDILKK